MSAVLELASASIRPMDYNDIAQVVEIEASSYDFPWSSNIFSDCLRVGYCCWVLDSGGTLLGYGIMSVAAQESHILNLCIDPKARRSGLARALLTHLVATATRHGATVSFLEVRPTNEGAIKLYSDMGFSHVGTRSNYYPAKFGREDALVLSIQLNPESVPDERS
jgi:[ribosomal protein S18]-alanine N-acetyltransferase